MTRSFLLFGVGDVRYALDVTVVERVVAAVEVTPLQDAPESVLGLINVAGELMPVVSARLHFGLPPRDMELTDRLIVTRAAGKPVALLVDNAEGVVELSEQAVTGVVPGFHGSPSAVATLAGRIVLIPEGAALTRVLGPAEGMALRE